MVNWTKILIGSIVFTVGFVEPTPFVEAYGLAIMANGLGVKLPVGW